MVGLLETRYGLLPDMGATIRLPRIVGESRARELILLGDVIDAAEALRIGLANRSPPIGERYGYRPRGRPRSRSTES